MYRSQNGYRKAIAGQVLQRSRNAHQADERRGLDQAGNSQMKQYFGVSFHHWSRNLEWDHYRGRQSRAPLARMPISAGFRPTASRTSMHKIAILALHDVLPYDLGIACDVFARVSVPGIGRPYRIVVCSEHRRVRAGFFEIKTEFGLDELAGAHTVIVPGITDVSRPVSGKVISALQAASARGCRIASICSGAFVLAAAGLLDGKRATTHWMGAPELATRYPSIRVDPNVLFVDNGNILTSAGASAGMDLCLHMIRADHGAQVAADSARLAVTPLVREGGQSQYMAHSPVADAAPLQKLMRWAERNLDQPLTLETLAEKGAMSTRTLTRRFREQTGLSPLQWLQTARVRRAQQLLETTAFSVERIAADVGFGSVTAFRERFGRIVGTPPQRYRIAFQGNSARPAS